MRRNAVVSVGVVVGVLVLSVLSVGGFGDVTAQSTADPGGATSSAISVDTDRVSIAVTGDETRVEGTERASFTFSAVDYVTSEKSLTVQLVVSVPPGTTLYGPSGETTAGGSQFTTTVTVAPGESRNLVFGLTTRDPGSYPVDVRLLYRFGAESNVSRERGTVPVQVSPLGLDDRVVRAVSSVTGWVAWVFDIDKSALSPGDSFFWALLSLPVWAIPVSMFSRSVTGQPVRTGDAAGPLFLWGFGTVAVVGLAASLLLFGPEVFLLGVFAALASLALAVGRFVMGALF